MLRRTLFAKQFALRGLEHAFQNFATLRGLWISDANAGDGKTLFGVPLRVAILEAQRGLGDETETSPFEIRADFEDLADRFEGGAITFPGHDPLVIVLDD